MGGEFENLLSFLKMAAPPPSQVINDQPLLSNLTFFNLFSNLKENYKCNRMSARMVLYNNQLYNIVGYLYLFHALSVH